MSSSVFSLCAYHRHCRGEPRSLLGVIGLKKTSTSWVVVCFKLGFSFFFFFLSSCFCTNPKAERFNTPGGRGAGCIFQPPALRFPARLCPCALSHFQLPPEPESTRCQTWMNTKTHTHTQKSKRSISIQAQATRAVTFSKDPDYTCRYCEIIKLYLL